ncbi:MAG: hypothetical protein P4M05_28290 [Bradyrhizobium sp.]|nr:hypothetical protein [Bradyrhizobium sp.]
MAFSSSGVLPKQMIEILLRNGRPELWRSVFVGCSGTFRTERALLAARPGLQVHSCDVSLFSTSIARLAMGRPLDFRFIGELAFFEDANLDPESRVAAIMVASMIGTHASGKPNRYKQAHLAHLRANFAVYVARTAEKLANVADELPIASYAARDFLEHVDEAIDRGAGFIAFPPVVKGADEKVSAYVAKNTDWQGPAYTPFDPAQLPGLLDKLDGAGSPFFIASDKLLDGRVPSAEVRVSNSKTVYAYTPTVRSGFYRNGYNEDRFTYTALDVARLHKKSRISIAPSNGGRLNFLKNIYLKKSIAHVSGQGSFEVYIDGMLAGGLIYARSKFGKNTELYLMSDFSTSRSGRVAKLIARIATSRAVIRELDLKFIERHTSILTTAFSDHPAAMKYRGSWEVKSRDAGPAGGPKFILNYVSEVREETLAETYRWWWDRDGSAEVGAARDRVSGGRSQVVEAPREERALHGPDRVQASGGKRKDRRQTDVDAAGLPA